MKYLLTILTLFIVSCSYREEQLTQSKTQAIKYNKFESEYETVEQFSIITKDSSKFVELLLSKTYFLFTEKSSNIKRCQESSMRDGVSVPVDYCNALVLKIKHDLEKSK